EPASDQRGLAPRPLAGRFRPCVLRRGRSGCSHAVVGPEAPPGVRDRAAADSRRPQPVPRTPRRARRAPARAVRMKTYGVRTRTDVKVPMRDGALLSTDLYLPAGEGVFPTVLIRTPYQNNLDVYVLKGRALASLGFALAVQDCRGRYDSDGAYYPF